MFPTRYKIGGLVVLLGVVLFSNLPGALTEIRAQEQAKLVPSAKLDLGGSKVNGFLFTADGKFAFVSISVGRESSVFLVAASTADTAKFYGKKIRGCPVAGEICLVQIRGNINPQDLAYNEAKKVLFVPGYDDDTLYISQVVFKDGNPTEAKAAKKVAVGAGPRAVAVNDAGTRAFTVNEREHTVSVVDILYKDDAPDKGEVIATININPDEGTLSLEQDKPQDIAVPSAATYVTIINRGPGKVEVSLSGGQPPVVVNPSPDELVELAVAGVKIMTVTAKDDKADIEWVFGPKYPSPADILIKGDKAYLINTDTWQACELTNINAKSEDVKAGRAKIELSQCVGIGAYPRAMTILDGEAYVVNSVGDSVSQLSLEPLRSKAEVPVGDAPRGIATDGQCWIAVTNTNVDNVEGPGASLTFIHKSLDPVVTVPVTTMVEGDPITPTQVQVLATADAKFAWVLNVSARGELLIYPVPDQVKTCP